MKLRELELAVFNPGGFPTSLEVKPKRGCAYGLDPRSHALDIIIEGATFGGRPKDNMTSSDLEGTILTNKQSFR